MHKSLAIIVLSVFFGVVAYAATLEELNEQVKKARTDYDVRAAVEAFEAVQSYAKEHPESNELNYTMARAALAVATLYRIEFQEKERFDPTASAQEAMKRRDMRVIGQRIDNAGWAGHKALDALPESSERERIRADIWSMMIRTSYRGNKHGDDMEKAANRAVELDPKNPYAYVAASKRKLFASERRGGDLETAMEFLNKALEINPDFEDALVLRGIGHEEMGDKDKAIADWKKALEVNPKSFPAQKQLERIGK